MKASGRNGKTKPEETPPEIDFATIVQWADQGEPHAIEALNRMAQYLGKGISMLVAGLAPDVIVVVGEIARVWDKVGPIVSEVVQQRSSTHASTIIKATGLVPQPRLRGIVALVLQRHFGAPTTA
jgi:predicted NBD/HSP70 family sugar kinase